MPGVTTSYGTLFDFITFFRFFLFIIDDHSCLNCVSPQNFHRLCIQSMYTFSYVNIPHVTAGYVRFYDVVAINFLNLPIQTISIYYLGLS